MMAEISCPVKLPHLETHLRNVIYVQGKHKHTTKMTFTSLHGIRCTYIVICIHCTYITLNFAHFILKKNVGAIYKKEEELGHI